MELFFSSQICHNGICDTDRCSADSDCPSCFACDTACGVCNTIPNCCMSHQSCPDWDGICDVEVAPTTCNYCADTSLCTPGRMSANSKPADILQDVTLTVTVRLGRPVRTISANRRQLAQTTPFVMWDFQTYVILKTSPTPLAFIARTGTAYQVKWQIEIF